MSRLVQTGSTARANTRNKCYRGLSSKQVESSAIRRHIWWILLQLGDNFFLGSQGRTKVWKKKKGCNSSHPTITTNETMTSTGVCTFGLHCSWHNHIHTISFGRHTTNHQLQYDSRNLHYCAIYHHTCLFSVFAVNAVPRSLFGVLFFG